MSFNWSEYLALAQELFDMSPTSAIKEADLRSAISRAYYAAFCQSRDHLIYKDRDPIPYEVNAHEYIVKRFENSSDARRQKIGQLLHHLRSTRNIADYQDVFFGDLQGRAKAALAEARRVIHLLSQL
jgi:uncharacterized protein (UPF0332 family)